MGILLSCCLKGEYPEFVLGRPTKTSRRRNIESLLSDRDNPDVDGRKASMPPSQMCETPTQLPSPSASSTCAETRKEKYTGPAIKSPFVASPDVRSGARIQKQQSSSFPDPFRKSVK
ncbi:hypothetical protein LSH36_128g00015 [Paralvinella palmiformis]|uniref:Uncharacterized protein n=1 Tax=Paralvinella palmiformis TaxID=53620 RepID=A0AAD9NA52_9ANNE|nr:hypothetical protein LSH36_128g00015 [Paralvinella palmiformis]